MTTDSEFVKIETCILKVNVDCQGCVQKVRKLLRKIEGVYDVNIDVEKHEVKVTGTVDSTTLIKKLARSGKHAELLSPRSNQLEAKLKTDEFKNQTKALLDRLNSVSRNQHFLPTIYSAGGNHGWEGSTSAAATNKVNNHLNGNGNGRIIINGDRFEENAMNMMMGLTGEDLKYSTGPRVYDYDCLPPMMKNIMLGGYPTNEDAHRCVEDGGPYYNMMVNENNMPRNQLPTNYASSPVIPFKFGPAAPPSYY